MAVAQCAQGHYYDNEKYGECPHCKSDLPATPRRGISDAQTMLGSSLPGVAEAAMRQKVRVDMGPAPAGADEKTIGIFRTEKGYDPVVGWLVCVDGKEKGRDFRLHTGRNYVGRALKSDIALVDDEGVSREDHCSVVFEPKSGGFHLLRGLGEGVVINGQRLQDAHALAADDELEIGGSRFVFVPFCGEGRSW